MQNLSIEKPKTANSALSYDRQDWQKGYESQPQEYNYCIDDIEGQIPPELHGTLFRNGPGLLEVNGQPLHHPFDGDGLICSIAISQGKAYFRNRFVRTEGYLAEQAAGKILYRGVFGTKKPGGWLANIFDLKLKNIANTNIIYWGKKLLALWEAAQPYRLDPSTLETIGLDTLDGILKPGDAFSAHPRIDPGTMGTTPRLVNFSLKTGLSSIINIYEFDPEGKILNQHSHTIPGFAFLHDFAITPNYCIFFQNPVLFNPLPFLLGWRSAGQCLQFQRHKPTRIIIIPRNGKDELKILDTESCFVFHHANAFEQNGDIFVDSVCYEALPDVKPDADFRDINFDAIPAGELWRFQLNLETEKVKHEILEKRCCEFPTLHPNNVGRNYRYLYIGAAHKSTGNAPLQAILKIDLETNHKQVWSAAPRGFAGEPLFVPHPDGKREDDGWVLMLMYDAAMHRSTLVILDAKDISQGPIAKLHLKHHIPYGLHGCFIPELFIN